jgi:peroxiredoxin
MDSGVPLGGTVVDDQGLPVDQVRIVGDNWREYKTLGLRGVTGSDGKFSFPHVPAGEIEFMVVRPGYGVPKTVTLIAGRSDHKIILEGAAVPLTSGSAPYEETKLKPGDLVPDLTVKTTDGATYRLSELHGKYVMLDCWASWCRPCMATVPDVKAVYEATKSRSDFVLIGISLDTDASAMKKACQDKGIAWPQAFGPKSGASEAFEALDGVGIPYICLIGPDGKLIAQHLRGPEMMKTVKAKLPPQPEKK